MGETRVDLLHLLEDLRDAYPGSTEETILTEIVANSLDSGAGTITITTDPVAASLTILDDGEGMRRRELARYHDIAGTSKVRGAGIGFAGVGIKVGLLVARTVVTETRRGKHHVATIWGLASRHRAPWKWTPPAGMVSGHGTAVTLVLENPLSLLVDAGFVEVVLRRHFQPLFDPAFREALEPHYPDGVRVVLNGRVVDPPAADAHDMAPIAIRVGRRRRPAVSGFLVREARPLPEEQRGLAVSTLGKVIRRGWDWLGMSPANGDCIGGLVEAPALAECLTLNKADFIRAGSRGALYLGYRKAIQEAVGRQLVEWGNTPEGEDREHRRAARPVERDLETVLVDLADDFPLLAALVDRRAGGQRRLPIGRSGGNGVGAGPPLTVVDGDDGSAGSPSVDTAAPEGDGRAAREANGSAAARSEAPEASRAPVVSPPEAPDPERGGDGRRDEVGHLPASRGARRPVRYGLSIQFESRPDDLELGRLVDATVWVNDAHPAYRRAAASRSEGYHVALATALALAAVAVEPARERAFVTAFLTSWGGALERRRSRRRR